MVSLINFPFWIFVYGISLLMPQTNTNPENWDAWKTILFFPAFGLFSELLLLVSGVASKGFSPLRPRLFVGMILILIFAEATEGELKSALNVRIFGGSIAAPKKSLEMFENLCWKKWDKFHLYYKMYISILYINILPNKLFHHFGFRQGKNF